MAAPAASRHDGKDFLAHMGEKECMAVNAQKVGAILGLPVYGSA
jgi:hypothetical protein